MANEYVDVLIVGAGLSGIGAAYHVQTRCPGKSIALLEARECSGGTWDLFRYPGIRSDSDMYTLGYSFRPWSEPQAIADGPSILRYVRETARERGIDQKIRYRHRVVAASWSSRDACWTVDVEVQRGTARERVQLTCSFLFACAGYYDYDTGYTPDFPGIERYRGRVVHPQKWTSDVDYRDKRVVVIGSGATAVTLVPELAKQAAHVTMLQRSPTYVVSRPAEDSLANKLREHLPAMAAYGATRWKNVLLGMLFYNLSRQQPERMKALFVMGVKKRLGADYDVGTHFTPTYKPWDQRVCLVPDGDLFRAIRDQRASVVTDHIERFTETGIQLRSGRELDADLVVTATGLNLKVLGGIELVVDDKPIHAHERMTYKGMMYSDVPNMALAVGYTNASWTLKCDLTAEYVCRLINHMDRTGMRQCTPHRDASIKEAPFLDFSSGYVQRSVAKFPKQGSKAPWKLYQNYARDLLTLRYGTVDDGVMRFSNPGSRSAPSSRRLLAALRDRLTARRGMKARAASGERS